MYLLLALLVQTILVVSELFVLGAFTQFDPTMKWAMWLTWEGGGVSVASTAISTHLLLQALFPNKVNKQLSLIDSAREKLFLHRAKTISDNSNGQYLRRFAAGVVGIFLLMFSLLTIASTSVRGYAPKLSLLGAKIEAVSRARDAQAHYCRIDLLPTRHRSIVELDALIENKDLPIKIRRGAEMEKAAALADEQSAQSCLASRASLRAAESGLEAASPWEAQLIRYFWPLLTVEEATRVYPIIQGVAVWFLALVGAAAVNGMWRWSSAPARAAMPRKQKPLDHLVEWLEMVELGSDNVKPAQVVDAYRKWCDENSLPAIDNEALVKELTKERMGELGVLLSRYQRVFAYRGISIPK